MAAKLQHPPVESKENDEENLLGRFPIDQDDVSRAIKNVVKPLSGHGVLSFKQLGNLWGGAYSTANHTVAEGRVNASQFIQFALACAERGDFSLVDMVVPEGYVLIPADKAPINHSLDDELADSTEHFGRAREAFVKGKKRDAKKYLNLAKKDMTRMEREIEAL